MSSTVHLTDDAASERSAEETMAIYDHWAKTYEQHGVSDNTWKFQVFQEVPGWNNVPELLLVFHDLESEGLSGPAATIQLVSTLGLAKDASILDAGAGTGRFGRLLKEQGYTNVHALDGSAEMLRLAEKDSTYRTYTQALLGGNYKVPFTDAHFDAVVMVSVFCPGHFGPDVLPELIRITKPGGMVCWGQRPPHLYGHKSEAFRGQNFHKSVLSVIEHCPCALVKGPVSLPGYFKGMDGHGYVLSVNS